MSIIEQIEQLKATYDAEISRKDRTISAEIADVKEKIDRTKKTDFAADYRETYEASLGSLERIFTDIETVHRRTHGITFRIGDYIKTCRPSTIARGAVEDFFADLVRRCRGYIKNTSQGRKIEDDIPDLKLFAQCVVDLRYIAKNADKLLTESGIPQREKQAELTKLQGEKARLEEKREEMLRLENLGCYNALCKLREEAIAQAENAEKEMLGARTPGFDGSYQFLIGFSKKRVSREVTEFAKDVMGLSDVHLKGEPVYFHLRPERDTILVKAKQDYFSTLEFDDFMCNLYFSIVTRLQPKALRYCGIECDTMDAVVGEIADRIHDYDTSSLFANIVRKDHDISSHDNILSRLFDMCYENSQAQKKQKAQSIFEYNERFSDNPQKFVMFCVNNYPAGFNRASGDVIGTLRKVINAGAKGVISVVCEATDAEYTQNAPMFEAEELQADLLEFADDGSATYNGEPLTLAITTEDFNRNEYWDAVGQYLKSAESKTLESLLAAFKKPANPDYITIPIGVRDGDPYSLDIKKYSNNLFGMIIGTIGSGKSSFLHTFLLSAAYSNSPEDLEFYLADFKSGEGSAAFASYRREVGMENLYLPHIRYLLLKGKTECAMDLLGKMEAMRNQRDRQIKAVGAPNVEAYNRLPDVVEGRLPKIPTAIFVIDEYNAMLTGLHDEDGGNSVSNGSDIITTIVNKVKGLIGTLRSYGIGMLFSGQSVEKSMKNSQALGNMGLRISLLVNTDNELISLFDMDSYDAKKQMKLLAGYGDALIAVGKPDTYTYVRTAYSGKENGPQQMRLAKTIREKYHNPKYDTPEFAQVDAGREDAVSLSELAYLDPAYEGKEGEILLDMGVAGASGLRVPLVYSTADTATNYLAYSNWEKLQKVERNAMLAFAAYAKEQGIVGGEEKPITYLALPDYQQQCLDPYIAAHPALDSYIDRRENLTDMAIRIMELFEVYKSRKRDADRGVTRTFTPTFLVVHNIAWVNDSDAAWLPDFDAANAAAAQAGEQVKLTPQGEQFLAKLNAKRDAGQASQAEYDKTYQMICKNFRDVSASAGTKSLQRFTVADVREALGKLYARGSRYGIFVLAATENYAVVDQILLNQSEDKGTAVSKYSVFGSLDEKQTHKIDKNSSPACVYLSYTATKTRLCDYEQSPEFWQKLEA